ncbi:MAG: ABC transporter permease [Bacillota bacterium]
MIWFVIQGVLDSAIRYSTPLSLAALGGMYTARTGILNFSLEGIMTMGAFMAVWGSYLTGEPWMGVLFGIVGGLSMGLVLGVCAISGGVNQVVAGTGVNILGLGLASFLNNIVYGGVTPTKVASFEKIAIPLLSKIPVIGPMLFDKKILTFLLYGIVLVSWFVIYKTPFGLKMRAIGDNPAAADSLGINVNRMRYIAVVISGILGGLAGAALSIGELSTYLDNMVAGRGYLAWGAVTVGQWNPVGVMLTGLLFGLGEAVQMRMQAAGSILPYQFLVMLPYVLTILVMNGFIGKTEAPHSMGKPFLKGGEKF